MYKNSIMKRKVITQSKKLQKTEKPSGKKHKDLKSKILEESLKIISYEGVGALSMRDVARRLNVSHGAPYRHFQNKEEIILELGKMGLELLQDNLFKGVSPPQNKKDCIKGYTKFTENQRKFVKNYPELYNFIINPFIYKNVKTDEIFASFNKSLEYFLGYVIQMQKFGLLKGQDPMDFTLFVFYAHIGASVGELNGVSEFMKKSFKYNKNSTDIMREIIQTKLMV